MNLKIFLLILLHEVCSTAEQILFKKGADNFKQHRFRHFKDFFLFLKKLLKTPIIWFAFILTGASWLIWFVVLAGTDLSIAIPVDSLQYVMILIASFIFLGERMNWKRVVGTIFILLGVLLVAKS
ncbi:MAG: EamA family transporter [bacterium]|nr:EamA family transporter [bacterium]